MPSLGSRAFAASDAAAVQAVTSGANPIAVKKGIDKACEFLIMKLRENSKPVKGTEDIRVSSALKGQFSGYGKRACQCGQSMLISKLLKLMDKSTFASYPLLWATHQSREIAGCRGLLPYPP